MDTDAAILRNLQELSLDQLRPANDVKQMWFDPRDSVHYFRVIDAGWSSQLEAILSGERSEIDVPAGVSLGGRIADDELRKPSGLADRFQTTCGDIHSTYKYKTALGGQVG